jgi:hypothetical protein
MAPRSIVRESKPLKKFPNFMALTDIIPRSEGQPVPSDSSKSVFLAKREC